MKRIGLFKRIVSGVAALAMVFTVAASAFIGAARNPISAYAETTSAFDKTNVTDDLKNSTIAGKKFNLSDFATLTGEGMSVYAFTEFGYELDGEQSGYGLYVYVLNPLKKSIITTSPRNRINLSFGNTDDYSTYPLEFLNYSLEKGFERLFYKFKVDLTDAQKISALKAAVVDNARVYKVGGVELCVEKEGVSDYPIGGIYTFTGYAKGYGSSSESTLGCKVVPLETFAIEVDHTTYRMDKEYKDYTKQALSSFYFSIPEKYFETYPNGIDSIKASWYEYKTTPIFVTSDSNAEAAFEPYIGIEIGEKESALDWRVMWEETVEHKADIGATGSYVYTWDEYIFGKTYNLKQTTTTIDGDDYHWSSDGYVSAMNWFFNVGKVDKVSDYKITGKQLEEFMVDQAEKFPEREKVVDLYPAYLFEAEIDKARQQFVATPGEKRGYVEREIFAGAKGNLYTTKDENAWQNWLGIKNRPEISMTYDPIVELSKNSQYMGKDAFSSSYLTDDDDFDKINSFIKSTYEKTGDEAARPILLRFAVTDYYSSAARFDSMSNDSISEVDGYVAQETMFLNAQVIHIAFKGAEGRVVIPVVCDPIDVIPGLDPPKNITINKGGCSQTLKNVFSIVIIALAIYLIVKFILALIKRLSGEK